MTPEIEEYGLQQWRTHGDTKLFIHQPASECDQAPRFGGIFIFPGHSP